jgi:hypothetical protein
MIQKFILAGAAIAALCLPAHAESPTTEKCIQDYVTVVELTRTIADLEISIELNHWPTNTGSGTRAMLRAQIDRVNPYTSGCKDDQRFAQWLSRNDPMVAKEWYGK